MAIKRKIQNSVNDNNPVPGLSVNNSGTAILRDILKFYLPGRSTFDCDLTFGQGDFYSDGIAMPQYRYDKYQFDETGTTQLPVRSLDEAAELEDECFESVVIDLPLTIDNKGLDCNAFASLSQMFETYDDMLGLADRLLKPGGILVFRTADFVLRNSIESQYNGYWATDYAIDLALELDFELTDRFILAERHALQMSGSQKVRTGLKHGYFLVFTKR